MQRKINQTAPCLQSRQLDGWHNTVPISDMIILSPSAGAAPSTDRPISWNWIPQYLSEFTVAQVSTSLTHVNMSQWPQSVNSFFTIYKFFAVSLLESMFAIKIVWNTSNHAINRVISWVKAYKKRMSKTHSEFNIVFFRKKTIAGFFET